MALPAIRRPGSEVAGSADDREAGGGTKVRTGLGSGGFSLGMAGNDGRDVFILAIRFGSGTSCWIWILGAGIQIICWVDFGLGAVAITVCFDTSTPRGCGELPSLLSGSTSGGFLRKS